MCRDGAGWAEVERHQPTHDAISVKKKSAESLRIKALLDKALL
jgi:hypothetical protein